MILLSIDPRSTTPAYRQIEAGIRKLAEDGTLKPGERLPSTRVLAQKLGMDRTTVVRAYQELWASGVVESRPGSYTTIRRRLGPGRLQKAVPASPPKWMEGPPRAKRLYEDFTLLRSKHRPAPAGGVVDFSGLSADRGLCPARDFLRALKALIGEKGREILDYGDPQGYLPLREAIARRMRTHGVRVDADEILITGGAQQALDLVLRWLGRPGDPVIVETPTYGLAVPLMRFHGLTMRSVPMGCEGMDLDAFEKTLKRGRPALACTIPTFHNPTGLTMPPAARERLLGLCERAGVPLVEDGFEEELKYFGKAVLPIKALDASGTVLYLGTLSKVVFPGLRIGWIAARREAVQRLLAILRFSCLSGNIPAQAAAARLLETGKYEQYLRRVHTAYRRRMETLLQTMKAHLPQETVAWTAPAGGYTLWVRWTGRRPVDEETLVARLLDGGVRVSPGRFYFPGPVTETAFRVSISNLDEAAIVEGIGRMARTLKDIGRKNA
jgi:DNA-binding transcriptional MocR family regulator